MAGDQDLSLSRSVLYRQGAVTFDDIWTDSPPMKECLRRARQMARSEFNLLILGETGTGKNLLAQAIHNAGPRRSFPFVDVDIASLAETVLSAELFGCVEGAFTGAKARKGYFRTAHMGTLFLDEIGNLSDQSQMAILSAVEKKRIAPVGSPEAKPCDVRLIAATNLDIGKAREDGNFRSDLYYRIARTELRLPPLRERPEDIAMLAERFLEQASAASGRRVKRISGECMERMQRYAWPGNVRELRSLVDRAMIDCEGEELEAIHLFPWLEASGDAPSGSAGPQALRNPADWTLRAAERSHILRVLEHTGWNRTQAARLLGISRATLYQKLAEYELAPPAAEAQDE